MLEDWRMYAASFAAVGFLVQNITETRAAWKATDMKGVARIAPAYQIFSLLFLISANWGFGNYPMVAADVLSLLLQGVQFYLRWMKLSVVREEYA
jgi:hypothetical protein